MSDGPSDCAAIANRKARDFAQAHFPKVPKILCPTHAPKAGTVVLVYEEWLQHVVELVTNRKVTERWLVEPFKEPKQLCITDEDWPVGYYRDNHLPREGKI